MQENLSDIQATGTVLWTISPDPQARLESYRQQNGFEFPMLIDPELEVIKAWGILNEDSGERRTQ